MMESSAGSGRWKERYLQAAAVRMTRRAQWFLINLPIATKRLKERIRAVDRARGV